MEKEYNMNTAQVVSYIKDKIPCVEWQTAGCYKNHLYYEGYLQALKDLLSKIR